MYQIKGDLFSRKNKILAKDISDKDKADELVDDLSRKGWIKLRIEETKDKSTTKSNEKSKRGTKGPT